MKKRKSADLSQPSARLEARIAPELKDLFTKAAKMQGTNLTNFIIHSARKEAEATIKQQALIDLSMRDITTLLEIESVSTNKPNATLKNAALKYTRLIK